MCKACGKLVTGPEKAYEYTRERVDYFQISYCVIDEIVRTYYGVQDYSFLCVGECQNDSCYTIHVSGIVEEYDADDAEKFRRGEGYGNLSNYSILDILCQDGWLSSGAYLVEVCW